MANKYINADELKKRLSDDDVQFLKLVVSNKKMQSLEELIDEIPAADVAAVVRCKDCKYYKCFTKSRYFAPNKACYRQKDNMGNKIGFSKSDNDFCSLGERRENNAEI